MKNIKLFLTAAAASFLPLFSLAQDVHFSQLTETPLLLNPATAGLSHNLEAIINFKDQWKSVSSTPYRTFNVSGDMAFLKKQNGTHMGVGLDVFSDKAGDGQMGTTTGQLHLSGILAANDRNLISVGLYSGFGQRSLTYGNLYWDRQYDGMTFDATRPTGELETFGNHTYLDFGAGVAWFYGKGHGTISSNDGMNFTAGFSLQHINKPVYSFYGAGDQKLPMKIVAHGNAEIGLKNRNVVLEPSYIVAIQGGHHEINLGMMFKYLMQDASHYTARKKPAAFMLGGYYRVADAAVLAAGYEFSGLRLCMSYDLNLSDLKVASKARGGFEVALRYTIPTSKGRSSALID
jgi:type IX secretion system PorP/SprF family membrane protein